jgi:8-oxo-dGTP diphosphatase
VSEDGVVKLIVTVIIVDLKRNIRLIRRRPSDFYGGVLEILGGNIEQDKTILDALAREIKEETYLASQESEFILRFAYSSSSGKKSKQLTFTVTVESISAPVILSEHNEYKWVHNSEIDSKHLIGVCI